MNFRQDALNQWRRKKEDESWLEWDALAAGPTRMQIEAKKEDQLEFDLFKE